MANRFVLNETSYHGVANAIILPAVMKYNAPATGEKYRDIAKAMGVDGVDAMSIDIVSIFKKINPVENNGVTFIVIIILRNNQKSQQEGLPYHSL